MHAAQVERQLLPKFTVPKSFNSVLLSVDHKVAAILNRCGVKNVGCLFDSVSVSLTGSQQLSLELRVRKCLEMISIKDRIVSLPIATDLLILSPNYIASVFTCAKAGGYSSIWTIFALYNVVGCTIESIYPPMNGDQDRPFLLLNILVVPQRLILDQRQIRVMWTRL